MSYSTRKEYTFMPDLSVGHHSEDNITTLNVPVISAYYQMRESGYFATWGLEALISGLEYDMWVTKTVEELVWGYDEPLFDLAKLTLPNPPTFTKFGFFTDVRLLILDCAIVRLFTDSCLLAEERHGRSPDLHHVHWRG